MEVQEFSNDFLEMFDLIFESQSPESMLAALDIMVKLFEK